MTLSVAHILRADHLTHVGGDLGQLRASVEALRPHGIEAYPTTIEELSPGVDVVHLYNLQRPFALQRARRHARKIAPKAPIVVSPIYWPLDTKAVRAARGTTNLARPLHWVGPRRRTEWVLNRRALRQAAAVLPNSNVEALRISRHYRLATSERWRVVSNGLWIDRWAQPPRVRTETPRLRIACVARLEPQKNQKRLARAVQSLPHVELTLVGPPGEERYASGVLDVLRTLGSRARWIRCLEQKELSELLSDVDVHVLPSFRETPGLASMEAAAAGCAIVVTREGSAEEYFGDLATYADPRSVDDLRAAILRAAERTSQPTLSRKMRAYDWSNVGRELAAIYREVVKRG